MNALPEMEFPHVAAWRTWLEANHARHRGIWLVFRKGGRLTLGYEDAIRQALCFGWVDSLIRRLDDTKYVRKFRPRRLSSTWSESNIRRWRALQAADELSAAGRNAKPTARRDRRAPRPLPRRLPAYIARGLRARSDAWTTFQTLRPSHRKEYVQWIRSAVRPETRARRLARVAALLAQGKTTALP